MWPIHTALPYVPPDVQDQHLKMTSSFLRLSPPLLLGLIWPASPSPANQKVGALLAASFSRRSILLAGRIAEDNRCDSVGGKPQGQPDIYGMGQGHIRRGCRIIIATHPTA